MSYHPQILRPLTLNAVIEPGLIMGDCSRQLRLFDRRGVLEAWTWINLPAALPARVTKGVAYIIPVADPEGGTHYVVTRLDVREDMEAFAIAPPSFGLTDADVFAARDLMEGVHEPALRQLLGDVFSHPNVFFDFWQAPHAPLGEVASLLRRAVALGSHFQQHAQLSPIDRDLGVVYAVLREIGHVWLHAVEPTEATCKAGVRIALSELDGPLTHFEAVCPGPGAVLRELLRAPLQAPTGRRAKALLRIAAQACSPSITDGSNVVDFPPSHRTADATSLVTAE